MSEIFTSNPLFERVERARRRTRKIRETHITLAHGSGGRAMHDLVEGLFLDYFRNPFSKSSKTRRFLMFRQVQIVWLLQPIPMSSTRYFFPAATSARFVYTERSTIWR
jgi:hypothetical protein